MVQYDNNCELFGSFGYAVQLSLGLLSFMILVSNKILTIQSKDISNIQKDH